MQYMQRVFLITDPANMGLKIWVYILTYRVYLSQYRFVSNLTFTLYKGLKLWFYILTD